MDKHKKVLTVVFMFLVLLIPFYIYLQYRKNQVVYHARLEKVSSSGEARFRWYDINTQKVVDPDKSILLVLCNA